MPGAIYLCPSLDHCENHSQDAPAALNVLSVAAQNCLALEGAFPLWSYCIRVMNTTALLLELPTWIKTQPHCKIRQSLTKGRRFIGMEEKGKGKETIDSCPDKEVSG